MAPNSAAPPCGAMHCAIMNREALPWIRARQDRQLAAARRRREQSGRPLPGIEATALSDHRERPESGVGYPLRLAALLREGLTSPKVEISEEEVRSRGLVAVLRERVSKP